MGTASRGNIPMNSYYELWFSSWFRLDCLYSFIGFATRQSSKHGLYKGVPWSSKNAGSMAYLPWQRSAQPHKQYVSRNKQISSQLGWRQNGGEPRRETCESAGPSLGNGGPDNSAPLDTVPGSLQDTPEVRSSLANGIWVALWWMEHTT